MQHVSAVYAFNMSCWVVVSKKVCKLCAGLGQDITWPTAQQEAAARSVDESADAAKRAAQRKGVQATFAAVTADRAAAMLKALTARKPLDKMESVPEAALEGFPSEGQLNPTALSAGGTIPDAGERVSQLGERGSAVSRSGSLAAGRPLQSKFSGRPLSELTPEGSESSFVTAVSRYDGDVGSEADYGSVDTNFDRSWSMVSTEC